MNPGESGDISNNSPFFLSGPCYFSSTLAKTIQQKATELAKLKANVAQIESSKAAHEALLKRVLELESKLSEDKK